MCVGYVGCARKGPLSHDRSIATRQIHQLLPAGTSEARARKALTDRGFHLARLNEAGPSYLLVATYYQEEEMWQVGVVIVAGKVAATSVTVPDGR